MAATTDVPRDPGAYRLSIHANQRRLDRDIPKPAVATTIEDGEVKSTHRSECRLFEREVPGDARKLGVVANVHDGEILTVMWRE